MNLHAIRAVRPLYKVLSGLRRVGGRGFMRLCHAFGGARPKRVFFSSFKGRGYTDSPARISEALHALRPDAELIWQLEHPGDAPDYVRVVKPRSLRALRAISTARCLVDNFNRPHYMLKFDDQRYVQTWHGDRPFKKILADADPDTEIPESAQMDLLMTGSDYGTRICRSAFRYSGEVMQLGLPRNDCLVNPDPEAAQRVRAELDLAPGTRVMLYAPTFRAARVGREEPAGFDIGRALDRLEARGEVWVCLTRAHTDNKGVSGVQDPRVRDVTAWPETSELLLVTDLLVTDYSSIAGDFALLDRPIALYQPDLAEYIGSDRDMYVDPREYPYARAESEEQLLALFDDPDALAARNPAIRAFYGMSETGRSAEAVAQWIAERLG